MGQRADGRVVRSSLGVRADAIQADVAGYLDFRRTVDAADRRCRLVRREVVEQDMAGSALQGLIELG